MINFSLFLALIPSLSLSLSLSVALIPSLLFFQTSYLSSTKSSNSWLMMSCVCGLCVVKGYMSCVSTMDLRDIDLIEAE